MIAKVVIGYSRRQISDYVVELREKITGGVEIFTGSSEERVMVLFVTPWFCKGKKFHSKVIFDLRFSNAFYQNTGSTTGADVGLRMKCGPIPGLISTAGVPPSIPKRYSQGYCPYR